MGLFSKVSDFIPFVNPMTAPFAIGDKLSGGGVSGALGTGAEALGLKTGDTAQIDPLAFKELYEAALQEMQGVGKDASSIAQKDAINSALLSQLGALSDQAKGREQNFLEDQSRAFSSDVQNLARARGGTGTMAQALRPSGQMYDAQARSTSRGLNDLYSKATQDLASLSGVQRAQQGQDLARSGQIADIYQTELGQRRGVNTQNVANRNNARQAQIDRLSGTIQGAGKIAAGGI